MAKSKKKYICIYIVFFKPLFGMAAILLGSEYRYAIRRFRIIKRDIFDRKLSLLPLRLVTPRP